MKENAAKLFYKEMKAAGINFVAQLPDAGFRETYDMVRDDPDIQFIPVTNEEEGVCLCAGAWLGGKRSAMVMENSGLRVASEALARLGLDGSIPVLLMMTYRGSIGDANWWALNHGIVMEGLLKALRIPYTIITKEEDIEGCVRRARRTLEASKYHVAIVVSGGLLW